MSRFGAWVILLTAFLPLCAQTGSSASLTGSVSDATGAMVRDASVQIVEESAANPPLATTKTDVRGNFSFAPEAGRYRVIVRVPGFAAYRSGVLGLRSGAVVHLTVRLMVADVEQQVAVGGDTAESALDEGASLTLSGSELQVLSNDSRTLEQQLKALTGTTGNLQFLVDGFNGKRLPPKSAIRSIRINNNPFSPYYQSYGAGGLEIETKPGADTLHGAVNLSGTDQPWDARNPYSPIKPPFYDFQEDSNVNGSIGKHTSYFVAGTVERLANNAIVNAASPANPSVQISTAVPAPELTQTYSLRADHQFSEHNFGFARNEWNLDTLLNGGLQPLLLPEAAYQNRALTNTLQLADTQGFGAHAVNQVRLQYIRVRLARTPNSTAPSVLVQATFQAGGSQAQSLQDNQDSYELQDLFQADHGHHNIQAGVQLNLLREANRSAAGFNGQYIFSSVNDYLAGNAQQYSQTIGGQSASLLDSILNLYALDDWKLRPNVTLSLGMRFESQSAIPDHVDPAPRIGFSWAVKHGSHHTALFTVRGGYGLFFDHFPDAQILQAIRQDGTRQIAYLAQNTGFNPNGPPPGLVLTASQPTTYRVDPRLHSAYQQIASASVQRSLGRFGSVNANLIYLHYTHSYLSRNLNAPLPGTVVLGDPSSGIRPFGDANLYQFSSDANGNLERFNSKFLLNASHRLLVFGLFLAQKNRVETDGVTSFAMNQYDVRADYGRAADSATITYNGGVEYKAPFGIQVAPFIVAHSGMPFNVTTGTDLNGDTIYNDRPSFAAGQASATVVATSLGTLNVQPTAGQTVIPHNYAVAPAYAWVQLRVMRDFHVGPRPAASVSADAKIPATTKDRPWNLSFAVEIHNLTNRNNPGPPVGVIGAQCTVGQAIGTCPLAPAPYFDRSLSLAPDFSPVTASNRTILLQTSFSW